MPSGLTASPIYYSLRIIQECVEKVPGTMKSSGTCCVNVYTFSCIWGSIYPAQMRNRFFKNHFYLLFQYCKSMFVYTVCYFDVSMYQIHKEFTAVRGKGINAWDQAFVFVCVQQSCVGRLPFVELIYDFNQRYLNISF